MPPRDDAELLVSDVRAQLELGERVLPLCPSRDKLLVDCRALRSAAERKASIGVVDWRRASSSGGGASASSSSSGGGIVETAPPASPSSSSSSSAGRQSAPGTPGTVASSKGGGGRGGKQKAHHHPTAGGSPAHPTAVPQVVCRISRHQCATVCIHHAYIIVASLTSGEVSERTVNTRPCPTVPPPKAREEGGGGEGGWTAGDARCFFFHSFTLGWFI